MNVIIRIIHSTLGKTLVISAFALSILITASVAVDSQVSGGLKGHGFIRDSEVFSTIDAPGATFFTVAFGRGENGDTTGGYVDGSGKLHGFLRNNSGGFSLIDYPNARATFAARINNNGDLVGAYSNAAFTPAYNLPHGFLLRQNGSFTPIDVPGARRTQPFGINNLGQIVGEYVDQNGKSHGFLREANGVIKIIDAPNGFSTIAFDINDKGQMVILSFDGYIISGLGPAYLLEADGDCSTINIPGGSAVIAYGINNSGDIVGDYVDNTNGKGQGFVLRSEGDVEKIDDPDARGFTVVYDINDGGQLAGAYDIVTHGYFKEASLKFTTIDHPLAIRVTGEPLGVNNLGQIVGAYSNADEIFHGFLRNALGFTPIDFSGAHDTYPYKINDNGQIVGYFADNNFIQHGFLYDDGDYTRIDYTANGVMYPSFAYDIDSNGQIVGEYQDGTRFHGFLRDIGGTFTSIDVTINGVPAIDTSITGVNDQGQMTGTYSDGSGRHAFLLDHNVATRIDVPGAGFTQPWSINNNGQIVGYYLSGGRLQGFLWANGSFTTLTNHPGALIQSPVYDIDDLGRITGVYY
jgi:probable HAF family extracellular repeat protein